MCFYLSLDLQLSLTQRIFYDNGDQTDERMRKLTVNNTIMRLGFVLGMGFIKNWSLPNITNCRQDTLFLGLCGPHQCSANTGANNWSFSIILCISIIIDEPLVLICSFPVRVTRPTCYVGSSIGWVTGPISVSCLILDHFPPFVPQLVLTWTVLRRIVQEPADALVCLLNISELNYCSSSSSSSSWFYS